MLKMRVNALAEIPNNIRSRRSIPVKLYVPVSVMRQMSLGMPSRDNIQLTVNGVSYPVTVEVNIEAIAEER